MAVIVICTTDKGNDGKKDKIRSTRIACCRYETDGSEIITGEDLELWYRDKIKEQYVPRSGIWWALQKHFTKFVQGDFDELEMKDFYEKDLQIQATELDH